MKLSFSLLMLLICIVYIYGLSPLEKLRAMNKEIDSYDILFSIGLVNSEMNKPNQDNNGTYKYRTKGDNNKDPDNWVVDSKEVIGKIIFNVKYIGYPTVVINNLLNR